MPICYKGMTFCGSDCSNDFCPRYFGPEQREGARRWWSRDPDNAPVAFSDFSGRCPDYEPPHDATSDQILTEIRQRRAAAMKALADK